MVYSIKKGSKAMASMEMQEKQANIDEQENVTVPERNLPRGMFKVINPVMKTVLRSPVHRPISGSLMLLSFKGRKSGKVYSTPVAYHKVDDGLLVFTHSPWWRNLEGGAPVRMLLQGKRLQGYAQTVEDNEEVFRNVRQILDKIGVKNARRLGLFLNKDYEPSEAELRAASRGTIMLRIQVGRG